MENSHWEWTLQFSPSSFPFICKFCLCAWVITLQTSSTDWLIDKDDTRYHQQFWQLGIILSMLTSAARPLLRAATAAIDDVDSGATLELNSTGVCFARAYLNNMPHTLCNPVVGYAVGLCVKSARRRRSRKKRRNLTHFPILQGNWFCKRSTYAVLTHHWAGSSRLHAVRQENISNVLDGGGTVYGAPSDQWRAGRWHDIKIWLGSSKVERFYQASRR